MEKKRGCGYYAAWVGGVLFLSLVVVCLYSSIVPDKWVARIRQRMKVELPVGRSKAQVVAYLKRHHIDHGDYEVCQTSTWPEPMRPCQDTYLLWAAFSGKPDLWPAFDTGDIEVDLYFDKQGRLSHYDCFPIAVYL